jgi:hypothetical protein
VTRLLPVLAGRPEGLRVLAGSLMGGAARLSAVNTVLLGLRAGAHWQSDSGRLFEAAVQAPPPVIAAVIERYAGAAGAIRALAAELEECQEEVTAALCSHREGWRRHDVLLDRLGFASDPGERACLERAIHDELVVIDAAQRRHAAAVERHTEADRRCARQLQALADDVLADPTGYTVLVTTKAVARPVATTGSLLPGPLRLVGVAGVSAGVGSVVGLLLLYGEGSWKQLGLNALTSVVTTAGSVLVAGSLVGGKVVLEAGQRVFTKSANPSTLARVRSGVRSTRDDWISATRRRLGLPVAPTPPRVPDRPTFGGGSPLRKVANLAQKKVDDAFVNNWQLATANGKGAQTMFVAGITTQKAPALLKQVDSVHDRFAPDREEASEDDELSRR